MGADRAKSSAAAPLAVGTGALALAGVYVSLASTLGIVPFVANRGLDGIFYALSFVIGWPLVALLAPRLAAAATLADVAAPDPASRRAVAVVATFIALAILMQQWLGATGLLITLSDADPHILAALVISATLALWLFVPIRAALLLLAIKMAALLMLLAGLAALALLRWGSVGALADAAVMAHPLGNGLLQPGGYFTGPTMIAGMGIGLVLGLALLPHIQFVLSRIDPHAARRAGTGATVAVTLFYLLAVLLGFAAAALAIGGGGPKAAGIAALYDLAAVLGGPVAVAALHVLAALAALLTPVLLLHAAWALATAGGTARGGGARAPVAVGTIAAVAVFCLAVPSAPVIGALGYFAYALAGGVLAPVLIARMAGFHDFASSIPLAFGAVAAVAASLASPPVWEGVFGWARAPFPENYPALAALPVTVAALVLTAVARRARPASPAQR